MTKETIILVKHVNGRDTHGLIREGLDWTAFLILWIALLYVPDFMGGL